MRALKARGVAIIFVSHRLAEVFAIADRIVVMRDGRIRGRHAIGEVTRARRRGRDGRRTSRSRRARGRAGARRRRSRSSCAASSSATPTARPARAPASTSTVRQGEIVGPLRPARRRLHRGGAGALRRLARHGRGRRSASTAGESRSAGPPTRWRSGIGLMAQDRRDGLIGDQSIADNIGIASLGRDRAARASRRRRRPAAAPATRSPRSASRPPSIDAEVAHALAAATSRRCRSPAGWPPTRAILILIDPTRGVDVGARARDQAHLVGARRDAAAPSCSPRPTPRSWSTSATASW